MKSLKVISLALCGLMAATLTSCNDDDDTSALTPTEVQTAFNTVKGSYDGNLIYAASTNGTTSKADTISVKFDLMTDSTLTIHNVPARVLSTYISDTTLVKTLKSQPAQDLTCKTRYVRLSPVEWVFVPTAASYSVNYKDKADAKVQIAFASNGYCYGAYNATKSAVQMQVVVAGVYVDGTYDKTLLRQPFAFYLEAKR